jgi:hypothetical protein
MRPDPPSATDGPEMRYPYLPLRLGRIDKAAPTVPVATELEIQDLTSPISKPA